MFDYGSKEMASALKTLQVTLISAKSHGLETLLLALMSQSTLRMTENFKHIESS